MGNELLIRAYNVGCGDCIYVRIPDKNDGYHILIDCGTKSEATILKPAVRDIVDKLLPPGSKPGKKRLDLIVATHRHEDHIKGFDAAWFKDVEVGNVWLSVAMDPKHPQAEKTRALHETAANEVLTLVENSRNLSPQLQMLAGMYGVSNARADDFLFTANPKKTSYVHAGMKVPDIGLPPQTKIHILAPEEDIDGYYLGEEADPTLRGLDQLGGFFQEGTAPKGTQPANISAEDFRVLRSRMLSNGLAFVAKDTSIQNNLSVVLLIEWKKRRLLFVGDAEWEREFKPGTHNGSWNVMWAERKELLNKPVHFLKIGHHGSVNATPPPFVEGKPAESVYRVLDAILPVPKAGKKPDAQAIVSTEREPYAPIPRCDLLVDLARRVSNTCNYGKSLEDKGIDPAGIWHSPKATEGHFFRDYEEKFMNKPQPLRTDLEFHLNEADFVEVKIEA